MPYRTEHAPLALGLFRTAGLTYRYANITYPYPIPIPTLPYPYPHPIPIPIGTLTCLYAN